MDHQSLQEAITRLEAKETAGRNALEAEFISLSDRYKPANIARRSLKNIIENTKAGFGRFFGNKTKQ